MENVQILKTNLLSAYKNADKKSKELLAQLFGMDSISSNVIDRVKTFEDACTEVGEDPENQKFHTGTPDEIAYNKLKVIIQALNECVELSFANKEQRKWYPWFEFVGSGFRFGGTGYAITYTYAIGGSRLCFHSEELAKYAGTQFIELYNQFLN
jgi:hypothetical protein